MRFERRQFLQLLAGAAFLPAAARTAGAQTYPNRPMRIIVGTATGSAPDILARLICHELSERLGQPFPYRGGGHMADLISGQVQVAFVAPVVSIDHIKAGKLRALAVSTVGRWNVLPDLPTMAEFLPGYESYGWFGIGVPVRTPSETVEKLNMEINTVLADPKIRARLTAMGSMVLAGTPADFRKFIADETEKRGGRSSDCRARSRIDASGDPQ